MVESKMDKFLYIKVSTFILSTKIIANLETV